MLVGCDGCERVALEARWGWLPPRPRLSKLPGLRDFFSHFSGSNLLTRMSSRPSLRSVRLGVTLVEVLVALAIIAVLIAMLLPPVMRVRGQAAGVRCQNNLRQLAIAFQS